MRNSLRARSSPASRLLAGRLGAHLRALARGERRLIAGDGIVGTAERLVLVDDQVLALRAELGDDIAADRAGSAPPTRSS